MTKIYSLSTFSPSLPNKAAFTDLTLIPSSESHLVQPSSAPYKKLLRKLDLLSATLTNIRKAMAEEAGLSYPQLNILLTLADSPRIEGMNVRNLASMLSVTGAFITVEVNKLVEAGYIRKTPNPKDKRSIHLKLTDKGWYFVADIMPVLESHHDQVFGHMTMKELTNTHKLLNTMLSQGQSLLVDIHADRAKSTKDA